MNSEKTHNALKAKTAKKQPVEKGKIDYSGMT
jgi:hypothetical protein